jgi:hypothetical protein
MIYKSEIIETKYIAPTNTKSARVQVKSCEGKYCMPYGYEDSDPQEDAAREYFTNQGYAENCPLHRIAQKDHYIFFVLFTHYNEKSKWFYIGA